MFRMAGYFIFFLVPAHGAQKYKTLTCGLFTAVPSTHSFLCSLCKEKKTQTRGEHTIQSTKFKKFSFDMMLAMCSDTVHQYFRSNATLWEMGVKESCTLQQKKPKQISLVEMWLSKFIIITLA